MFALLASVTLVVVMSAAEADAARFYRSSHPGSRSRYAQRYTPAQRTAKPGVYPRARQIDGRTLWDLGKQKGQWPSLP